MQIDLRQARLFRLVLCSVVSCGIMELMEGHRKEEANQTGPAIPGDDKETTMATRPMECGTCGIDHPSAKPCPKPNREASKEERCNKTIRKLESAIRSLNSLLEDAKRDLYNGKIDDCDDEFDYMLIDVERIQKIIDSRND